MDEVDFTLDGTRYRLSRDAVIRTMARQTPGRIHTYAVDIDGITFPVKQVLAQSLGIPAASFISTRAQDILGKLGFEVVNVEEDRVPLNAKAANMDLHGLALELAVSFESARATSDAGDVLSTAERFEQWLSQ
jgi:hypothetical protein